MLLRTNHILFSDTVTTWVGVWLYICKGIIVCPGAIKTHHLPVQLQLQLQPHTDVHINTAATYIYVYIYN